MTCDHCFAIHSSHWFIRELLKVIDRKRYGKLKITSLNIDNDEKHQCSQATRMMNNLKAVVQKEKALVS